MSEKKLYETTVVMDGSMEDDAIKVIVEKVKTVLQNLKCEVKTVNEIGRKKLAYKIGKATIGYYVHFEMEATPDVIAELERQYRLNEQILRFLTVILDKRLLEIRERVAKYGAAQVPAADPAASAEKA